MMEILRSPKATDAKPLSTEKLIQCTEVFAKPCNRGRVTLFWSSPIKPGVSIVKDKDGTRRSHQKEEFRPAKLTNNNSQWALNEMKSAQFWTALIVKEKLSIDSTVFPHGISDHAVTEASFTELKDFCKWWPHCNVLERSWNIWH